MRVVWVLMCFLCSSDFENKFVCGEIMSFDDLKELGSEAAVKAVSTLEQCLKIITVTHKSCCRVAKCDSRGRRMRWWTGTSRTGRRAADCFACIMRLEVLQVVIAKFRYSLDGIANWTSLTCERPNKHLLPALNTDKFARRVLSTTTTTQHRISALSLIPYHNSSWLHEYAPRLVRPLQPTLTTQLIAIFA